jgi:nucleoside-diphosphate-sugar epimerase
MIFQAYGPGQAPHLFVQAALRAALAGEDFAMTSGDQLRDWIYLEDVVDGLAAALARDLAPGKSFDLGTGHVTSLIDVAKLVYRLVGRGGKPLPGALPDRSGESYVLSADVSQSTKILSWVPQFALLDGLNRMIAILDR